MRKITFLMLFVALCSFSSLNAQTTLKAGDVAIIAMNSAASTVAKKTFDFVPLVDIQAGTVINFTDAPFTDSGLKNSEGIWTYTAPTDVPAGTPIHFGGVAGSGWTKTDAGFNLASGGDNILVFQGDKTSPTFIYGVGFAKGASWVTGTPDSSNSKIPTGLSEANNTITNFTSDNCRYTGLTTGTRAEILAALADKNNWEMNSTKDKTLKYEGGNFTITKTASSIFHREIVSAEAWVSNGQVNVKATAGERLELFNAIGQKVVSTTAQDGVNTLSCDAKGVLIVKVANRVSKVIL